jgi:hypothetical protein
MLKITGFSYSPLYKSKKKPSKRRVNFIKIKLGYKDYPNQPTLLNKVCAVPVAVLATAATTFLTSVLIF